MEPEAPPQLELGFDEAAIVGAALAMAPDARAALSAALDRAADLCDAGELEGKTIQITVDVGENFDVAKAEHYADRIRTTGLAYALRTMRGAPVGRLRSSRPRERRSSAGRRRSTSTTRDDGSDSDGPGDAGPPRRRFVVDDHYLVVAVVA